MGNPLALAFTNPAYGDGTTSLGTADTSCLWSSPCVSRQDNLPPGSTHGMRFNLDLTGAVPLFTATNYGGFGSCTGATSVCDSASGGFTLSSSSCSPLLLEFTVNAACAWATAAGYTKFTVSE